MSEALAVLRKIQHQLKAAGAKLPIDNKGTIESAMQTGLSIALAVVEKEIDELHGKPLPENFGNDYNKTLESIQPYFDDDKVCEIIDCVEQESKLFPDPVSMTNNRPTEPGWYWYELPGTWAIQPALVFDAGDGFGLFYTLDPIASDVKDAERDGLEMDKCSENARWSSKRIVSINAEPLARMSLTDDEIVALWFDSYDAATPVNVKAFVRDLFHAMGIKEQE